MFSALAQSLQKVLRYTEIEKENLISDKVCECLRKGGHGASREIPYFSEYHSQSPNGYAKTMRNINSLLANHNFKTEEKFPSNVDISFLGEEHWIIEAKLQPYRNIFFNWNYCKTGSQNNLESNSIKKGIMTPILKTDNGNFFMGKYEGTIWADILRLLQIRTKMKKTTPEVRMFLLFYINNSVLTEYLNNLPTILNLFNDSEFKFLASVNPQERFDIWPRTNDCNFISHQFAGKGTREEDATKRIMPFVYVNDMGGKEAFSPILIEIQCKE